MLKIFRNTKKFRRLIIFKLKFCRQQLSSENKYFIQRTWLPQSDPRCSHGHKWRTPNPHASLR